jgi:starvation-inducible DNA-binding protein
MDIDIGIPTDRRAAIAEGLSRLLADSYTLYLKTHNYHWNVTGPMFQTLHTMFMTQYTELGLAVDDIAERIRALGEYAPQGPSAFANLTSITEGKPEAEALEMLKELLGDHETLISTARAAIEVSDAAGDEATTDLLTQRLAAHEKAGWMLRATLGGR